MTTARAALFGIVLSLSAPPSASPAASARALREQAFDAAYNLDYPEAVRLFDQAIVQDPGDSATYRARAAAAWLHIVFGRGSISVDQYLGGMRRSDLPQPAPPAEEAKAFATNAAKALQLAEQHLAARPNDVQALYDVGAAVGVQASYGATVEGRVMGSFHQAKRAFDSHERVLALDPSRKDAGLIVGSYRYIIATLSLPARLVAYLAGFGGGKAEGLRLVEDAAHYPSDSQVDAQVALLLLYSREGRHADATTVARGLMTRFPRNRLFCLETASALIRAGQMAEAEGILTDGFARFAGDTRPRAFGEEALWWFKRGVARLALRKLQGAGEDLEQARRLDAADWVKARIALERGKLADLQGRRQDALQAYRSAIPLSITGNDDDTRAEAGRLLRTPFK